MEESTQVSMDDMEYTECFVDDRWDGLVVHPAITYHYTFDGQMKRLEKMLSLSINCLEEPVDCDISRIVDAVLTHTETVVNTPGGMMTRMMVCGNYWRGTCRRQKDRTLASVIPIGRPYDSPILLDQFTLLGNYIRVAFYLAVLFS